jgi:PAS domain S-box-containing protein
MKNIQRLFTGSSYVSTEYTFVRKNGTTYPALVTATPRIHKNKVTGLRGLVLDITERKKMEESLEKEQLELNRIIDSSPIIIFYKDKEGKFVRVNEAFAEALRIPKEKFFGKTVFDFYSAEIARGMANDDLEVLESRCPRLGIIEQYESASGMRWVQTDKVPILDTNGISIGLIGFAQDITERKKAEDVLRQERDMLESVAKASGAGLVIVSKDYRVLWANDFIRRYKGDTIGKLCYATLNSLDAPCSDCGVAKIYAGKTTLDSHEYFSTTVDGDPHWVEIVATPLTDEKGNVTSAVEICVDITERKKAEKTSKKEAALIDLSPDAIIVKSMDETITFWNAGAEKLYGYTKQEALGQKINILLKAKHSKSYDEVITQLKQGKSWTGEITNYTKNNNEVIVQSYWTATLDAQGDIAEILESNVDITERKKAEEAWHESEQKFKALFSSNPDAAVFVDTDFHVVEANSRFSTLFGFSLDEIKGKIVTDLIVPDDSEEESRILRQKIISGSVEIVTSRKRQDGSQIPLFMSGGPVFVNGKVIGSIMVYKDISDIITVQEELTKALAKAELLNEKLSVVGSLTRHDVRNKLSAVAGYAYLLKKKHADQADILDEISKMKQSINEIVQIFDFAKIYEQLGIEELTYINVEKTLKEAIALFSGSLSLEVINDCRGLTLLADSLLRELFYNLIDNSLKHGEKVTKIRVHYEKVDEGKLIVVYEDDGIGISVENKPHLFKEGFSTSGTSGYGLFLIRKMMEVYGWTIEENGVSGKGAKFIITIPRTSQTEKASFQIT